ncbi:transposase [Klebsiella pneumoniae]|nr:transposase [Klebsiella pneumoniae]
MAKQKLRITNWKTDNKAPIKRSFITFWLDHEAVKAWYETATPSSRGRPQRHSDFAITTVLMIKRIFRLICGLLRDLLIPFFPDGPLAALPGLQQCQQKSNVD